MRYHFTPTKMAIIQNKTNDNIDKGKLELLCKSRNIKWVGSCESSMVILDENVIGTWLSNSILCIYFPKRRQALKEQPNNNNKTNRNQKPYKHRSAGEWRSKFIFIRRVLSSLKKYEISDIQVQGEHEGQS